MEKIMYDRGDLPPVRLDGKIEAFPRRREKAPVRLEDVPEAICEDVYDDFGIRAKRSTFQPTYEGFYIDIEPITNIGAINAALESYDGARCVVTHELDDQLRDQFQLSVTEIDEKALFPTHDDDDDEPRQHHRHHHRHHKKKRHRQPVGGVYCKGCLQGILVGVVMSAGIVVYMVFFK